MKRKNIVFRIICKLIFALILFNSSLALAYPSELSKYYPHWDLTNEENILRVEKIEKFIENKKSEKPIALFDWDGTLVDEHIISLELVNSGTEQKKATRSLQSVWHIWGAYHMKDFSVPIFPMFDTESFKDDLIFKDDYLESKTEIEISDYNKFTQIATLEAGMTPADMNFAVQKFLEDYKPETFVYFPMLDLIQRLIDQGFEVWIVTGSNPYFVSSVLHQIEKNLFYEKGRHYRFSLSQNIFIPGVDHLVGNSAKLLKNGHFSMVFDNRYLKKGNTGKNYVVNTVGKAIAVEHFIEPIYNGNKVYFCAGNSGGDLDMMNFTLSRKGSLGLTVNARGALKNLSNQENIIKINAWVDKNRK